MYTYIQLQWTLQLVSFSSYDMYPPPHMTCILLLISHVALLLYSGRRS